MAANPGDARNASAERLTERRRYNRRQSDTQPAPPYFETFDRIAGALEGIEQILRQLAGRFGATADEAAERPPDDTAG
jgi:hypothetical protein